MATLADIIAPVAAPPAPPPYGWIALGTALLIGVLGIALYRWYRRTRARRRARARLNQTERALRAGQVNARQAAHAIAQAVQDVHPPRPTRANDIAWQGYMQALQQARFAPQPSPTPEVLRLLDQTRVWIQRPPC